MNTPTPRTDACAKSIDQSNFADSWKDDFEEFAWVTADFARTLETELTAVTEQRDRLAAAGKDLLKNLYSMNDNSKIASIRWMKEALQSLNQPTQ